MKLSGPHPLGRKWRVIGGITGFVIGAGVAVSGVSTPLGFIAIMAGGAIGIGVATLVFLIYTNRLYAQFSIRDLLLVTVIVALAVGWWADRSGLAEQNKLLRRGKRSIYTIDGPPPRYQLPNSSAPTPNPTEK